MAKTLKLKELPPKRVGSFDEVDGDLIALAKEGLFNFIGHGCNCFATMGAGIALPIGINFPNAKRADKMSDMNGLQKLGNFTFSTEKADNGSIFRLFNFYSQFLPGPAFDAEALTLSLRKFVLWHEEHFGRSNKDMDNMTFGLPLIGCGIAGGDWKVVSEIIKKELAEFDVVIVHFKEEK